MYEFEFHALCIAAFIFGSGGMLTGFTALFQMRKHEQHKD